MAHTITLHELRRELIAMSGMIEQSVDTAIMGLVDRNDEMAQEVIRLDAVVDEMENDIDRACQSLLREPGIGAEDFRFVVASSKICRDLERMSDQAVDISRSVSFLVTRQSILDSNAFSLVLETTEQMVRDSVTCLMNHDADLAWHVVVTDDQVDAEVQRMHDYLVSVAQDSPEKTERAVHLLYIVRALERIADQATNVAEEVIFMIEGRIVRHHIDEYRRQREEENRKRKAKKNAGRKKSARAKKKKRS